MAVGLARVIKGLRRLRAKKKLSAQAISNGQMPVHSGLWVVGASFSCRWGVQLPSPLNAVKQWYNFRPSKVLRSPIKLSGIAMPPWLAWRSARHSHAGYTADVLLINRAMELVGFDLDKKIVMRRASSAEARTLMQMVDNLRPTYPCPGLTADPNGEFIFEELILGTPLSRATAADRLACASAILNALRRAAPVPLAPHLAEQWTNTCNQLIVDLPGGLQGRLREIIPEIVSRSVTGWIHGDLSGENIVFRGQQWFVIDFDQVTVGPAFFDLLSLAINEAGWGRGDLLGSFFGGEFDAGLGALGFAPDNAEPVAWRMALCAATVAWWCLRGEVTESNGRLRLAELLEDLQAFSTRGQTAQELSPEPSVFQHRSPSGGAP